MEKEQVRKTIQQEIEKHAVKGKEYLKRQLEKFQLIFNSPIINPWKLVTFLEIKLYKADLSKYKVRGFFKIDENNIPLICYHQSLSNPELRFTIMHEIAHKLLLDYVRGIYLGEDIEDNIGNAVYDLVDDEHHFLSNQDQVEQICDEFAIEALMPETILNQFENRYGNRDIGAISDYFGLEPGLVSAAIRFRSRGGN